jgi:ABC-type sugar transport system ATPase subunit
MRERSKIDTLGAAQIESPRYAPSLGIGLVSQELSLVPQLDVAQNIFLGQTNGLERAAFG